MAKGFTVTDEYVGEDDKVVFSVYSEKNLADMKRAIISRAALERLSGDEHADSADIFKAFHDKIASRAGDHWEANPKNDVIILGLGDF